MHPSRSIITRALGSDPDMYADHFSIEVANGDRVIICSDGLSSMVPDSEIESVAVSSATPQQAADNLVSAALTAGGADNVTVIVVDILNDGVAAAARKHSVGFALRVVVAMVVVAVVILGGIFAFAKNEWYLGVDGDTVGIYQGIDGELLGISLSNLVQTTAVEVSDLPANVATQLENGGLRVDSEEEALSTVESYRSQIDAEKTKAAEKAAEVTAEGNPTGEAAPEGGAQTDESGADSGTDSASGDSATSTDASGTTGVTTQTNEVSDRGQRKRIRGGNAKEHGLLIFLPGSRAVVLLLRLIVTTMLLSRWAALAPYPYRALCGVCRGPRCRAYPCTRRRPRDLARGLPALRQDHGSASVQIALTAWAAANAAKGPTGTASVPGEQH